MNKYLQSKNIRGVWDGTYDFKLNPKAPIIVINADGAWGDKSKAALAIFQKNNGLDVDGMVGCKSTKKLIQQSPEQAEDILKKRMQIMATIDSMLK